ncbi:RHD3/Sey1 [Blastocladiella britannica]|nr:RHD3/Sey1 [Blastocladiella britannica]
MARLQIIDESKAFSQALSTYMGPTHWALNERGFDYNIVAVFGSQSTGKSTLLNRLFSTDFDVMDERVKRGQTTKGIWLARAPERPTLVMDVEGTDGRERGEDQDFERKSSLFAIAIAEVIIINLWENMVGLYHGANMGLLKTVLEVNLELFQAQGSPKTHLFFVIRDHASGTPLESLGETVLADIHKIWASISKPVGKETSTLEQFFDVTFTSLPHKKLASADFESEAVVLRGRFVDPSHPDYVFRPAYKKKIPADGFTHFAEDIWTQINANRDLDLPSQQELLAQFRCDELAVVAADAFGKGLAPIKAQADSGNVVEAMGATLDAALDGALVPFDTQASRYHQGVYQRKRKELVERAQTAAAAVFAAQLRNASRRAVAIFKNGIDFKLKAKSADFYQVVESSQAEVTTFFTKSAAAAVMTSSEWSYEEALTSLKEELAHLINKRREEELDKLVHMCETRVNEDLPETVADYLTLASPTMWADINGSVRDLIDSAEADLRTRARALRISDEEQEARVTALRTAAMEALLKALTTATNEPAMVARMRSVFEQKFRYTDQGVPRVWRPTDDIDTVYQRARTEASKVLVSFVSADLPLLASFEAAASTSESLLSSVSALRKPLIPAPRERAVAARFQSEVDVLYMDAKRSVVATTAHIPRWVLVVMVILGWNEFKALVSSPMYLLLFILLGAIAFVVHATGMSGPLLALASTVGADVARQVGIKVQELTGGRGAIGIANEYAMKTFVGDVAKPPLPPRREDKGNKAE